MTTYATCSLCCESFPTDDLIEYEGRLLCRCCYEEQTCTDHTIHDYYYKPSPIFFGEGLRYFGVELEVDAGGESDDNAAQIIDIANACDEHIYCKHDGSLDDGFEIVTHPMTLAYHQQNLPWSEILSESVLFLVEFFRCCKSRCIDL